MAERDGRDAGGIAGLVQLIERHRGAFEYDWRTRFGLPLSAVPEFMDWAEALRMVRILGADPTSQVGATLSRLDYPVSREFFVLADLFDLQGRRTQWKGGRKPKPYPRPNDRKPVVHGKGQAVSVDQWRKMRAQAN